MILALPPVVVFAIAACLVFGSSAQAQGTAVGWVTGSEEVDQTARNVDLGAGSFDAANMLTDPSEAIFVQADFPHVRVRVDSRGLDGGVGYGAAFFEDSLMVLGGTGSAEIYN